METSIAVVAAGTGEGKTSISLGLAAALRAAGHRVAAFKAGPDYIDAALYERVTGARARNIDLWLDGPERVAAELRAARASGATVLVEGMMGLFDGDSSGQTSTAHILNTAGIPAVVVLDGWRMSQSAAAVVLGLASFEPRVRILGAVLNRCGGPDHRHAVERALAQIGIPLLAALAYDPHITLPERHLGIDPLARNAAHVATTLAPHLAPIAQLCQPVEPCHPEPVEGPPVEGPPVEGPIVAYAQDEAFWFTYPQTLEALRSAGAHPVAFSPLHDRALPAGTRGLWLGGGYPELHAAQLAANDGMRTAIARAAADGMPVYAECGGMMYLADELRTPERAYPGCGVLRGTTSMEAPALTIGYRTLTAAADSILDRAGDRIRAYEFHYASGTLDERVAYEGEGDRGALRSNVLASFVHRRFFAGDSAVCRFVDFCR